MDHTAFEKRIYEFLLCEDDQMLLKPVPIADRYQKSHLLPSRYTRTCLLLLGHLDQSEGPNLKFCIVDDRHLTFLVVVNPSTSFHYFPWHKENVLVSYRGRE